MNNPQRGVYQPAMDNIPIYDLSDDEVEEEEHSRLPLLIVIALLVLAAFAGVVWLAYNQGVARGRAGAAVIIAAPDGPVRTAPANTGDSETPYTGLKVYGQPVAPEQEAQGSTLAPEPQVEVRTNTIEPAPAKPARTVTEAPPVRLNPPAAPAAVAPPLPPPAATATVVPPAPPPVVAQAAPPPSASASSAVSGKAVLQIGAYETPEIANSEWTAFKKRHAATVGGLTEDVQRADLGPKGIWYRLRVGPFADKAVANTACEKLKAEGGTCFVAAP